MLASQRRATIVSLVEESGAVRVSDLVEQLGVSDMTIRRDIEQLAARASSSGCTAGRLPSAAAAPRSRASRRSRP